MSASARKARELVQREQLILDTAQRMLHQHGYAQLTMDKLAEAVEYSKGTLYNHFSSKEDLVCSLSCRCISKLIELFNRAANYQASTRERFLAIGIAYSLHYQLNPLDAQNIQIIKINAVREKVGTEKIEQIVALEKEIIAIAVSIVKDAITSGELKLDTNVRAENIVFGCWAMHYGSLLLDHSDIPLKNLGINPTINLLWDNSQKFLDGFNWPPLSSEVDSKTLFNKLCNDLFKEEIEQLNNKEKLSD